MDLLAVLAGLRVAGLGLLLDEMAPVGQEGDRAAVRGEPGVAVVLRPDRQLASRAVAVGRDGPQRVAIAVLRGRHGLDGETASEPSGESRGSVAIRRPYRSSGRKGRVTGGQPPGSSDWAAAGRAASDRRAAARDECRLVAVATASSTTPSSLALPSADDARSAVAAARARDRHAAEPAGRPAADAAPAAAEPFDSAAHLFEPAWGGLRALAFIGPAETAGGRRRAGRRRRRPQRRRRGCRSSPGWRSGSTPARRSSTASSSRSTTPGAPTTPSSRGGSPASRAGRSRSSRSTCSISTGARC